MNKEVLDNLVRLFAIMAKANANMEYGASVLENYLSNLLTLEELQHYLELYHEYYTLHSKNQKNTYHNLSLSVRDSSRLLIICESINQELSQPQKANILFSLLSICRAKGVNKEENDFLETASDIFHIPKDDYNAIKAFSLPTLFSEFDNDNLLFISSTPYNSYNYSKHLYIDGVVGYFAVLHVPSVQIYVLKYVGEAQYLLNGSTLVTDDLYVFLPGSVVVATRSGFHFHYSDVVACFSNKLAFDGVTLQADNLFFRYNEDKVGLHPFSFSENAGRMVGIMGPSGAGKSTLLELLTGNLKPTQGAIYFNGQNFWENKESLLGHIGYVPQDDLLIEELSVFENLFYTAKLIYGNLENEALHHIVHDVLKDLSLQDVKDLRVGSTLEKSISGGERKRVNIGLELLRKPSVIFLDEPSSGLSSKDTVRIMDLLKEIALSGKLVIVVIHQPSSEVFKLFDSLWLMDTGGYPIFQGNPIDALRYFKQAMNQVNSSATMCMECGNIEVEEILNIVETRTLNQYGRFTTNRRISPQKWYEWYKEKLAPVPAAPTAKPIPETPNTASVFRQYMVYLYRDFKSKLHNKQYLAINLLQTPALALLMALLTRFKATDSAGNLKDYSLLENENIPIYFFISVIVAIFTGLVLGAEEIYHDRKIMKKEAFLRLNRHSYLLAKVTILSAFAAVMMMAYVLIGNSILSIQGMNMSMWATLFACTVFAVMLGLNISSAFKNIVTIYILIPIALIPQLVLGGVVISFNKMNPIFTEGITVPIYAEVMASRWAYESIMVHQFMYNDYQKPLYYYDRAVAEYEFKKRHLIPVLYGRLERIASHFPEQIEEIPTQDFTLVANQSRLIAQDAGAIGYSWMERFNPDQVNQKLIDSARIFLDRASHYYSQKLSVAYAEKGAMTDSLTNTEAKLAERQELYYSQHNNAVADLVKARNETERIVAGRRLFYQRDNPIFQYPTPDHYLDFRSHFFAPFKYCFGKNWSTSSFNPAIIWGLSVLLYLCLYLDIPLRFMNRLTRWRKYGNAATP